MNEGKDQLLYPPSIPPNKMDEMHLDDKILRMMEKMGYKSGSGLGKSEQGIKESVDVTYQLGKKGLGLKLKNIKDIEESWNISKEEICIPEQLKWLECTNEKMTFSKDKMSSWIKEGIPITTTENSNLFCDQNIYQDVLNAKEIFNDMDLNELMHARSRANPFETLKTAFFMNRAALKIANIDALTNFMFSNIDNDVHYGGPFYFADVCAGPGGFSEYIFWRKKWYFKGFGLTLKEENDFKLTDSSCASSATFQAFYGETGDGNVCCPANILDFKKKVMFETNGIGVHFMMSDGGFSVEGKENLQEVLSKNIYICQCLVALEIVRSQGHFVTKLFDIVTPFSVGLIYLIYKCFEKVAIVKPNSSRPANAERYLICSNLKRKGYFKKIKSYLWEVVKKLWELRDNNEQDILEIVSMDVIKQDETFCNYIIERNNSLTLKQITALKKLATFSRNPTLIDPRQEELRKKCLELWQLPDKTKSYVKNIPIEELINSVIDRPEFILVQPREIKNLENFTFTTTDTEDWHYCGMFSSRQSNVCNFYAGTNGSKVYRLQTNKWIKVKNMQLCKGTVLYGEFVKEINTLKTDAACTSDEKMPFRYTLQVIDALQLGDISLGNMKFKERMELIGVYCKSVNKELQPNTIRIRQKPISRLEEMKNDVSIIRKGPSENYISVLPVMGFNSLNEHYIINSLLFLKTNHNSSKLFRNKGQDHSQILYSNGNLMEKILFQD